MPLCLLPTAQPGLQADNGGGGHNGELISHYGPPKVQGKVAKGRSTVAVMGAQFVGGVLETVCEDHFVVLCNYGSGKDGNDIHIYNYVMNERPGSYIEEAK